MLKGMVRAVFLLGLVVAVPALSSIPAETVVFVTLRFGGPPAVGVFGFGGGNIIQLPGVVDATLPGRIATGPDGKIYVVEGSSVAVYAPGAHGNVPPLRDHLWSPHRT